MNDDELLGRLQAADPARSSSADPSWIPDLVEATMNAPDELTPRRSWAPMAAAAALVAVLGGGYALAGALGGDDADPVAKKPTSLSLALPASDITSICLAFDPATLKQAEVAFSGTVESVADGKVTLDVDRWYQGAEADTVVLDYAGAATQVALDGVEFTDGKRYLVSGSDGTVGICGYSGPWSEDFAAQFAAAFGS